MNRGAPITPKGKNESEPSQTKSSSQSALDSFLAKARNIRDWEENTATENLYTFGKKNGVFKNDENHLIWHLIEKQTGIWKKSDDSRSQDAFGRNLLSWMLRTPDLLEIFTTSFKTERRGKNDYSKRMPLHFAIDKCNLGFIACFIDIYATSIKTGGKAWGSLKNASIIFTQREELNKQNLLQYAAEKRCLLTSALVKICPPAALIDSDENGYTAFHTALAWPPGATQDITTRGWDIPSFFHSKDVFNAVIDRYDANDILCEILPKTNNEGSSVFQEAPVDHVDIPKLQELIFEKLKDISKVSTALYGTGKAKELCLDMSDFNSPSHNFEKFVDRLIELNPLKASGSSEGDQSPEDSSSLVFETSLLFVHLPDLNYIKQPCSPEVFRKFFQWLSRQVENIRELKILDSTTSPLSDWFFCKFVSTKFHISKLDWRKLDIDLTILAETGDYLEELTLYSSGNWGVLYHWTSLDGLAQYPKLSKVTIHIVRLDTTKQICDQEYNPTHSSCMKRHVERLKDRAKEAHYTLEVHVDSVWDYQTPHKDEPEDNLHTPKHRYLAHFDKYHTQLDNFANHSDNARLEQVEKFNRYSKPPRSLKEADPRIKVAIIDNGADINRSNLRKRIHAGVSYVSADKDQPQQPLPWWMVSDPHGTQMASLVEKVNPHCRLYIARVGKGRNDIKGYHAAKAIAWALEQNVDVISMSWTTTKEHEGLKNAVRQAAYSGNRRATLMFCSTADEGAFSGTIYPVHYKDHVIRVSATDDWGFQTSQSKGDSPADVLVPGEKAQAGGPGYIGNTQDTVSGSSVATALAAGLASLALLLLRTRNGEDKRMREFYTKLGMMKVFNKMRAEENGVLKLSTLFPIAENPDMALWDIENFLD